MNLRKSRSIFLAALVGFACGALMFHTPTAKAQYGSVTVQQVPILGLRSSVSVSGDVIGFACTQSQCYVASK